MADDLGYGDLGCYGQTKIKTPNIDKLASEGIRFTSFYAGSTVCAPSRAAFMLGQDTGHLSVRGNAHPTTLTVEDTTVAQVLKASGYHTGLIGKWGLADVGLPGVPQKKGFDEFVGYLSNHHAHDYYPSYLWRYDPPRPGSDGFDGKVVLSQNENGKQGLYVPDLCTKAAMNYIRINKPMQFNRYQPFFLFLSYTTPHANNEAPKEDGKGMPVPSDEPYSNQPWPQVEKNKAAMITRMDSDIGKIMEQLAELKIESNTVVFFVSDNGAHKEGGVDPKFFDSSGPLRGIKRDLTEGGIRVPMIVRWPGKIAPGRVSDFAWAAWDFMPTAAAIARTQPPENIQGISILPLLEGDTQTNRHEYLYWEFHERGFKQAIRKGDWKAIREKAGGPLELYDLKTDLGEKNDVAKQHPDVVAEMEKLFKQARTESTAWPITPSEGGSTNTNAPPNKAGP